MEPDAGLHTSGQPTSSAAASTRERRTEVLREFRDRRAVPYRYPVDHDTAAVRAAHDLPPDTRTDDRVRMAGRLDLVRRQGGLTFGVLRDRTGTVQLFVDTAVLGAD